MNVLPVNNQDLMNNTQKYYLNLACFKICLAFSPSENTYFKKLFIADFLSTWKNSLFTLPSKIDFTIILDLSAPEVKSIVSKDAYYLNGWNWDFTHKRVTLTSLHSIWVLQLVLRHLLLHLLQGRGFVLHASAVLDINSYMHVFIARSGGGKSTTAEWLDSEGMKFVADDSLVIVRIGSTWTCYGLGVVEKGHLPLHVQSSKYRAYVLHKSKNLRLSPLKTMSDKLYLVMSQLWLLTESVDVETYKLVTLFVKESEILNLFLPLRSKELSKVLYEN